MSPQHELEGSWTAVHDFHWLLKWDRAIEHAAKDFGIDGQDILMRRDRLPDLKRALRYPLD